ncbi:proline-rich receptor-like protein kinase PERK10 [Trachypithecus francoisi]|uniref:proline-rich receptor-like protein kinase PERK10 n=1 Tax=Trachypithecus francoisi TaxID=54180 RepID=UPI00141BD684|nr:proline-rich receptor-like protein kinase PERK10 [Trachypithecus francoisi]
MAPPRVSNFTTLNQKHQRQLLHRNTNSGSSTVSSSMTHKLENSAPPCISSSTTLNEKHQQRLPCRSQLHNPQLETPTPALPNTNSASSTSLQLHDLQLETPTPAPPRVPAPRLSTRNTNTVSSAGLQLHDPEPETPTTAPPRVSSSTTHKLENNAPPCISSCTTLNEKHQQRLLPPQPSTRNTNTGCSTGLQLHDPELEIATPAPPRVSSSTTLNEKHQQRLLRVSPARRPSIRNTNSSSSLTRVSSSPALQLEHQLPDESPDAWPSNWNIRSPPSLQLHGSQTGTSAPPRSTAARPSNWNISSPLAPAARPSNWNISSALAPAARPSNWNIGSPRIYSSTASNWNISSLPGLLLHGPKNGTLAPRRVSSCMALKTGTSAPPRVSSCTALKLEHRLPADLQQHSLKLEHQLPAGSPAARPSNWNIGSPSGLQLHGPQTGTSAPPQVSSCTALKLEHELLSSCRTLILEKCQLLLGSTAARPSN